MPHAGWRRSTLSVTLALLCASCDSPRPAARVSDLPTVHPVVFRTLPHDTRAFTQGLLYEQGRLYESTGSPEGHVSSLRVLSAGSGAVERCDTVTDVFAEGIAVLGGTLYQLTWREGTALLRTFPGLRPVTLTRRYDGEGWGLASDGTHLIMSNGSDTLYWRNADFTVARSLPVRLRGEPLRRLNELEYAAGRVYANVWYSVYVYEIDPTAGEVTRIIDCSPLAAAAGVDPAQKVLNGIAWDATSGRFYLTGKDWPAIFEVTLP